MSSEKDKKLEEARRLSVQLQQLLDDVEVAPPPPPPPPVGPTFREIWVRYFREEGRGNDTAKDIERRGKLLCAFWGDRQAIECTTELAEIYRDIRHDPEKCRILYVGAEVPYRRDPTPSTVNRELECARRALQWACDSKPALLLYNPLARVRMAQEKNIRQSRIQDEATLQRLLAFADPVERAATLLGIDCGTRRMEFLTLRWSQLFMAKDKRGHDQPIAQLWDTKNGRNRRIGLSWRTYEAIQALPKLDRYIFVGRRPGEYRGREAPIRPGTHLGGDAFLRRFQRLCVKAGVRGPDGKPLRLHDLRHSFAFMGRVVHKANRKDLMDQGGWVTEAAFNRYGIDDDEQRAGLYDTINQSIERQLDDLAKRKQKRDK